MRLNTNSTAGTRFPMAGVEMKMSSNLVILVSDGSGEAEKSTNGDWGLKLGFRITLNLRATNSFL